MKNHPMSAAFVLVTVVAAIFPIISAQADLVNVARTELGTTTESTAFACFQSPANQVALYRAENNADDSDGLLNASLLVSTGFSASGRVGSAFSQTFGSGVAVPRIALGDDYTVEMWINPASTQGQTTRIFAHNSALPGFGSFEITNQFALQYRQASVIRMASAPGIVPADTWSHVAITRSAADNLTRIYLNGAVVATSGIFTARYDNVAVIGGASQDSSASNFNGRLDEVALYNRSLTVSELLDIFQGGSDGRCDPAFRITPRARTLFTGGKLHLSAVGGQGATTYSIQSNNTGGVVDPGTGIYTAGPTPGTDVILATDSTFATARAVAVALAPTCAAFEKTWDGGGTTNNWSEAANWTCDQLPATSENVFFTGLTSKDAVVDVAVTVRSIKLEVGYKGTITQSAALTLAGNATQPTSQDDGTFICGGPAVIFQSVPFILNGGTFNCSASDLHITGASNFFMNGGTFRAPAGTLDMEAGIFIAGGTFDANGGTIIQRGNREFTVTRPGNAVTFNNYTVVNDSQLSITASTKVIVNGTFNFPAGSINGGTIEAHGPVNVGVAVQGGSATIAIMGNLARTVDLPAGVQFPILSLDAPNVAVGTSGTGRVTIRGMVLKQGTFNSGAVTLQIGIEGPFKNYTQSGGTFLCGGGLIETSTLNLTLNGGNFDCSGSTSMISLDGTLNMFINGGTFTAPSQTIQWGTTLHQSISGSLHVGASGTFLHPTGNINVRTINFQLSVANPDVSLNDLIVNVSSVVNGGGTVRLNNMQVLTGGVQQGSFDVRGNFSIAAPANVSNGASYTFSGTNPQTLSNAGGLPFTGGFTLNKPSGTLTLLSHLVLGGNQFTPFTLTNGTITTGNFMVDAGVVDVTRTNGFIIGRLSRSFTFTGTRLYPVGTASGYSPVTANITTLSTNPSSLTISAVQGAHPNMNSAFSLGRYWSIVETGAVTATLTFNYLDGDVAGNEANYRVHRISGNSLQILQSPTATINTTANSAVVTGVTDFSEWSLGAPSPALQISPGSQNATPGSQLNFSASGGYPPYTFALVNNNSGAIFNAATGVYTAGQTLGTQDTVRVTDFFGNVSNAVITVDLVPTKLAFTTQPENRNAGQVFSPPLRVAIQDANGNTVTNATHPVTVDIGTNPAGGTLVGTVTRNAVNGIATFDDLSIAKAANGYRLGATTPGLASATSNVFSIFPGTAATMQFETQPTNTQAFEAIAPAVTLSVRDALGNPTTNGSTFVTITLFDNPGNAQLSGVLTVANSNGIATFDSLRLNQVGTGYTLRVTTGSLTPITSSPFDSTRPVLTVNATSQTGTTCTIDNCTLAEAISAANNLNGADSIHFNLSGTGPHLIAVSTALPSILQQVTIDATTQPGYAGSPVVGIGSQGPALQNGFSVNTNNVTIRGFRIGNFLTGIRLNSGTSGSVIRSNHIGINFDGEQKVITGRGVFIQSSNNNIIGGPASADRNVIVADTGIDIAAASGNTIQGNYIGTNSSGTIGLNSHPALTGVSVSGSNNVIGGTGSGEGNLISGNGTGINLLSSGANSIMGNRIGPNAAGSTSITNPGFNGIAVAGGVFSNNIGGTAPGEANVIAYNTGTGLRVGGILNTLRGNSIHSNGQLGIDLVNAIGVSQNDPGDDDSQGNNLQNFPTIVSATSNGVSETAIAGILSSRSNSNYALDFYSNPTCDASGHGEGEMYLGSVNVATDGTGIVSFNANLPIGQANGRVITATATDSLGNTSEFSACRVVSAVSTISGRVFANGQPLVNTEIRLSGGQTASTLTDADGNYAFENVPNGQSYTLTPVKPGYTFTPASRTINPLTADQTGQDFAFTLVGFRVSGSITAISNGVPFPLGNVALTLTGPSNRTFTTKAPGTYFFNGLPPGSYTLTPQLAGYTFTPPTGNIEITTADISFDLAAQTELAGLSGRLAFESTGSFASNADGSGEVSLNTTWRNPAFSRDGTRIAYNRTVNVTINGTTVKLQRVFVANADGSNPVQLATAVGNWNDEQPAWSWDGQRIVFRRILSNTNRLMVFNLPTQTETIIDSTLSGTLRAPTWTFDDGRIIYYRDDITGLNGIYSIAISALARQQDGPEPRGLLPAGPDSSPAASPADRRLQFAFILNINAPASSRIIISDPSGLVEASLPEKAFDVVWSPDATRVAVSGQTTGTLYIIDASNGTVLSAIGSRVRKTLSWAPDPTAATPSGSDVGITVGSVGLTFSGVAAAGTTTVRAIPPSSAGTAPSGFQLGSLAFEITTTAVVSPPITVCFTVPVSAASTQSKFNALAILHNEGGVLVDRTISRNFATRQICASVTSLSPFVLAEQVNQALPSITGLVRDANGDPLSGVEVNLFGTEELTTLTDQDGIFSFVNLTSGGNYIVQPKQVGYLFSEYTETFVGVTGDETAVFIGTPGAFTITGRTVAAGIGIPGVTVELDGDASGTAVTDANGEFNFPGLPADGTYFVRPLPLGYIYQPADEVVSPLIGDAVTADFVRFGPTAAPISIGGRVTTADGRGIAKAAVRLTDTNGVIRTTLTNPFGYYSIDGVPSGRSYILEVANKRYSFPSSPRAINADSDVADADFIGDPHGSD